MASRPEDCEPFLAIAREIGTEAGRTARAILAKNLDLVIAEARRAALVVACWGKAPIDDLDLRRVIREIRAGGGRPIYCLGINSDGTPKHPMARGRHRVPDDTKPIIWRAA